VVEDNASLRNVLILRSSLPGTRSGQKISNRSGDKFSVRLIIINSDEAHKAACARSAASIDE